jgi:protein tyrosine phosphatase
MLDWQRKTSRRTDTQTLSLVSDEFNIFDPHLIYVFQCYHFPLSKLRLKHLIFTANESRVILSTDGETNKEDYINASFVDVSF